MNSEKEDEEDREPTEEENDKDLMKSTMIALGWEEIPGSDDSPKKASKDDIIKQLQQEKETLERESNEKSAKIEQLESELEKSSSELADAKESIDRDISTHVGNENQQDENSSDIEELQEKLALQQKANVILEAKFKELGSIAIEPRSTEHAVDEEMDSVQSKIKDAMSTIDEKVAIIMSKDEALEEMDQKIIELEETNKELKKQIVDIVGENTDLNADVQAKLDQASQLQSNVASLEIRVHESEEENTRMKLALDTLKSENEDLRYHVGEYESIIDKQKTDLMQSVSDTSEGMSGLQQIIDEQKEEILSLKKYGQSLNVKCDTLTNQLEEAEKKRIGIEAVLEKTNKDLTFYQEKYFDQKNRIKELDVQVEELQSSNDQKTEIIKDLEIAKETFDAAKEALESEKDKAISDLEREKEELVAQLESTDDAEEVKVKLAEAEGKIDELESSIKGLQESLDEKTLALEEEKTKQGTVEEETRAIEEEKQKLEEKIEISNAKINQLEEELEKAGSVDDEVFKDAEKKESEYLTKIEELEKNLGEAMENTLKLSTENSTIKEDLEQREKEIEKYKRRSAEVQTEGGAGGKLQEENKDLKVKLKEMRRRLGKYEKVDG